jgi:hypothetical protein
MSPSLRSLLFFAPALALQAACADGRAADAPPSPVPTWLAAEEPARVIGAAEGEAAYQFDGIAAVRRTADGTLAVADRGSKEIRLFDGEGRHLRSMGRAGAGPGEFEGLGRIFLLPDDSIAAWDANAQRLTVFAPDGRVGRVETLPLPGAAAPVEAILEDGTLVARAGVDFTAMIAASEGERRLPVTHLVRAPGSTEWREVGPFPGREELVHRTGASVAFAGVLFGRDHVVSAGRRRWYTGETDRFAVTVRSPAGDSVGVLAREHAPRQVTGEMVERARADRRAAAEESRREIARRMGAAAAASPDPDLPHRATLPAYDQVVEDAEENVWVRHFHFPADAPQRWSVFSPGGELVAEAETPAGLRVQQIGADWIVGVAEDELGVEVVEVYALARR